MSPPYAIGMLVIAIHLAWQTRRIDLARPEVNYRLFLANILTGVLLACTALSGTW
jgi:4-hydroxybenzoate polyprenyltransferase